MSNKLRFQLESPLKAADDFGGYQEFWQDEGYFWGEILSQSAARMGNYDDGRNFHKLKIRLYDIKGSGLRAGWRLRIEEEIYEIFGFENSQDQNAVIFVQKEGFDAL